MGEGISYGCDCGYGEEFTSGYGRYDDLAMTIINTQRAAYCVECGFIQPKILLTELKDSLGDFLDTEGVELLSETVPWINNNNKCKKCNGDLNDLGESPIKKELDAYFDHKMYKYKTRSILECTTCKEFKDVDIDKEYFVDINTRKVIKRDDIKNANCNKCQTKLVEMQTKEVAVPDVNLRTGEKGTYTDTMIKCPKCGKFDVRTYEMLWD